MQRHRRNGGFTLAELVIIFGILSILLGMALLTLYDRSHMQKEKALRAGLREVRQAIKNYYRDHGRFPCAQGDFNRKGDLQVFRNQLLWYTNQEGKPSNTRSHIYCYGPYLKSFPAEPFSNSEMVVIDTLSTCELPELKKRIADSDSSGGGWYYQAENGFFIANLNRHAFKEYYVYY